jgi:2-isopropylmalate synthase
MNPNHKYKPVIQFSYPSRTWPDQRIEKAPIWCSVDLRDGNQSLVQPMSIPEKLEFFDHLVKVGFREIEVGYPASSDTEFQFLRRLIDENRIPENVTVQILTQSRSDLIERSFESLRGVRRAIFHFYNSTSEVQRRIVFQKSKSDIIDLAVTAARQIQEMRYRPEFLDESGNSRIQIEYSPESFSSTEPEFALEICERVIEVFNPTENEPITINLPATVEVYTPNVYADVIEWFGKNLRNRKAVRISLHTHNDRGTGVAASELGLLAGADRIEGTLLGNGERTGNVDIVTLALNLYTQGINPELDFSDINQTVAIFEKCNRLRVPERHPYAGELVHTAFSGSHQDAIHKGFLARAVRDLENENQKWEVPYLPIDPKDIGRDYRAVIRINSQSGKGGVSYLLEKDFGIVLDSGEKKEFGKYVKEYTDRMGREINTWELKKLWEEFASGMSQGGQTIQKNGSLTLG